MDQSNKSFFELMPAYLQQVIELVLEHELSLLFVGGSVRSYLFHTALASDLDAEWRPTSADSENWESKLARVKERLRALAPTLSIKEAGVGVVKISCGDYELEFSTPRVESYLPGRWDHSNFSAHFDPTLSYEAAFKRRDFTINAIGLLLRRDDSGLITEQIVDPYHGVKDYELKQLRPVSGDFHRDPVRILRALRFQLTLGFNHAPELETELKQGNLSALTTHYFAHEARKVGELSFLAHFFSAFEHYHWALPPFLMGLCHLNWPHLKSHESADLLARLMALIQIGATENELKLYADLFGHRHKEIKKALRLSADSK